MFDKTVAKASFPDIPTSNSNSWIQKTLSDHETTGHDNITPESTSNISFGIQNHAEADRENWLAKACEQAYFDRIGSGSYGLCYANRSNDSDATPTASCLPDAPGYLNNFQPHLIPSQNPKLSSPPITHLDTHLANAVDEKEEGKMPVTELEAEPVIWESDQETTFENIKGG